MGKITYIKGRHGWINKDAIVRVEYGEDVLEIYCIGNDFCRPTEVIRDTKHNRELLGIETCKNFFDL